MIEDSVVYGWAHHYYIEPKSVIDAELNPKPKEKPKTDTKTATTSSPTKSKEKPKTETKPKKKGSYADNPLLKSIMEKNKGKGKLNHTADCEPFTIAVPQFLWGNTIFSAVPAYCDSTQGLLFETLKPLKYDTQRDFAGTETYCAGSARATNNPHGQPSGSGGDFLCSVGDMPRNDRFSRIV